ncbi:hypothetical protein BJY01DRAFT_212826 [Aspergillus pseudoustus]|uniref:Uncharacterized protein n=1 Tax=Aspergillus pseudoustus TaxID=1810923 RepID=A0ABR4K587_9EURO
MIRVSLERKTPYPCPPPTVVRAIPNLAVNVGRGVTIVEEQNHAPLSQEQSDMVVWIFGRVGKVFALSGAAFRSGVMMVTGGFGMMSVLMDAFFNCPLAIGLNKTDRRRLARMVLDGLESNIDHGLGLEHLRVCSSSWPSVPVTEALHILDRDGTKRIITEAMRYGIRRIEHDDQEVADGRWISE